MYLLFFNVPWETPIGDSIIVGIVGARMCRPGLSENFTGLYGDCEGHIEGSVSSKDS